MKKVYISLINERISRFLSLNPIPISSLTNRLLISLLLLLARRFDSAREARETPGVPLSFLHNFSIFRT